MKGIRNNLLAGDIVFVLGDTRMQAKWADIFQAWQIDSALGTLRTMPKLTSYHVAPKYIKKMKVSYCTQVFSRSVAVGINVLAVAGIHGHGQSTMQLRANAQDTAKFVQFMDNLFDSLNGSSTFSRAGKIFKNCCY